VKFDNERIIKKMWKRNHDWKRRKKESQTKAKEGNFIFKEKALKIAHINQYR